MMTIHQLFRIKTVVFLLLLNTTIAYAQRAAVSTDPLKWGTLSPNIGLDIVISEHTSFNIEASFNPFENSYANDLSFKHISFSPEYRYWFKRPLYSHYLGIHTSISAYDIEFAGSRYHGQSFALGIGYGYSFVLGKRWNLTPYLGVGYGYVGKYKRLDSDSEVEIRYSLKPMVTRFGISLVYILD